MKLRALASALVCLALVTISSPCASQTTPDSSRRAVLFISGGTSHASRQPDGFGMHFEAGMVREVGGGFSLRLEAARHAYGEVPQYPCMVQDADRCYQTLDRQVTAGILSAVYDLKFRDVDVYFITGAGAYWSKRVATRYPSCDIAAACDRNTYKLDIRDTQFGVSGGIGTQLLSIGKVPVFADVRLHFMDRTTPSGQPSNDYFLLPVTIGLRL